MECNKLTIGVFVDSDLAVRWASQLSLSLAKLGHDVVIVDYDDSYSVDVNKFDRCLNVGFEELVIESKGFINSRCIKDLLYFYLCDIFEVKARRKNRNRLPRFVSRLVFTLLFGRECLNKIKSSFEVMCGSNEVSSVDGVDLRGKNVSILVNSMIESVRLRERESQILGVLNARNVDVVMQMGLYKLIHYVVCKTSEEAGIPFVCMPDCYNVKTQIVEVFSRNKSAIVDSGCGEMLNEYVPGLVADSSNGYVTRYPLRSIVPYYLRGYHLGDVWRSISHKNISKILCKNKLIYSLAINDEIDKDKLCVVGNPLLDNAIDSQNKNSYGENLKKVVFSIPYFSVFDSGYYPSTKYIHNVDTYIDALVRVSKILKSDFEIIINLHPRFNLDEKGVESILGLGEVSERSIEEDLIRADILVSYVGSIVNVEMCQLGKPVLALSLYDNAKEYLQNRYEDDLYFVVEDQEDLCSTVEKIIGLDHPVTTCNLQELAATKKIVKELEHVSRKNNVRLRNGSRVQQFFWRHVSSFLWSSCEKICTRFDKW